MFMLMFIFIFMFIFMVIFIFMVVFLSVQTGVMLLENVAPVVSTIRSMEEDDGVPLSYPYPVATVEIPAISEDVKMVRNFTDNDGKGKFKDGYDVESAEVPPRKTQNSRQFGRSAAGQHNTPDLSSSGISAPRVSSDDNLIGALNFPIQDSKLLSTSSFSAYGSSNVQSKAAAAAKKWKSAMLSSSTLSSKVRYAQGRTHIHTRTHTRTHTLTDKHLRMRPQTRDQAYQQRQYTYTCTYTHTHTHTHTYIHTYIHTQTHTQTNAKAAIPARVSSQNIQRFVPRNALQHIQKQKLSHS